MKSRACLIALALGLPSAAAPGIATGEVMASLRKSVVTVDVPVAIPLSSPLKDRFGIGAMPSLGAAIPVAPWLQLGLRLRCGFLSNGPAPSQPGLKDPGIGGLTALLLSARVRPTGEEGKSLAAGPWMEVGLGPGLTGNLVRATAEAGLGWNFLWGGVAVGPTARYLQVVQSSNPLDSTDAKLVLLGIEVALRDPHPGRASETQVATAVATDSAKVQDRDGDGIPDDVDQCPNEPEDKDGFQDDDGCPDPDNDGDGIPDAVDKCPNEPETVNGFQDDDGCPDEGPIVVKKDRIYLKEHLLFDTNRARVKTEGRPALRAVLEVWTRHPEWDHLIVDGHTDRHGPDAYNLWLSHLRAERVRKKLIDMGFPEDKLTLRAFGRRQLHVPEQTEEADRENRRVEFVIVKKVKVPAAAEAAAESAERAKAAAEAVEAAETPDAPEPIGEPSETTAAPPPTPGPLEPPPTRTTSSWDSAAPEPAGGEGEP